MKVILASASPRRRELIKKLAWVDAEIFPSHADENESADTPVALAETLARKKAECVFAVRGGVVIGADTVVYVSGRVLGKPSSADEAREFFRLMCGKTHEVITGLAVVSSEKKVVTHEITRVTVGEYDRERVERYIASGAPFDKAGGYGAQDEIIRPMIKSIDGGLDNVIGLPVELLRKTLEENFR